MPIVLLGRDYWRRMVDFDALAEEGMIVPRRQGRQGCPQWARGGFPQEVRATNEIRGPKVKCPFDLREAWQLVDALLSSIA
jgi:hypothetical protein